uniref:60S ribosomal protein L7a n=1 Tax=Gongylonema pulchrum TaxID=637853 RepID=A0A183F0R1_9BILA
LKKEVIAKKQLQKKLVLGLKVPKEQGRKFQKRLTKRLSPLFPRKVS